MDNRINIYNITINSEKDLRRNVLLGNIELGKMLFGIYKLIPHLILIQKDIFYYYGWEQRYEWILFNKYLLSKNVLTIRYSIQTFT